MKKSGSSIYQGNTSLSKAIYWFVSSGWIVSIPLSRHQKYDLLADNGEIKKIKIVSTNYKTPYGVFQANLRVIGGNRSGTGKVTFFDPTSCDFLFVVCFGGKDYLIPSEKVKGKSRINLAQYSEFETE